MKKGKWLECENLEVCYKQKNVLNNISFNLSIGENTVILGPNGSGKSTLLKTIAKIKSPKFKYNSYLKIFGNTNINIWKMRSQIGYVMTDFDYRIKKDSTVCDVILSGYNGSMGIIKDSFKTPERIDNLNILIKKFDLNFSDKLYFNLSDGQKRCVLIARSIINNPKILVLDEPTSMLDLKSNYQLLNTLSKLTYEGITMLYVTNNIENIIKETKRVIAIKNGYVLFDGSPSKVINSLNISNLYDFSLNVQNIKGYWRTFPESLNIK